MSISLFKPQSAKPAAEKINKAELVPFGNIVRLMLPKIGVGYLFAMLTSVYDRVMINELGLAATLVGFMLFVHNLMSILQVVNGRVADRRALFGLRRTPFMFIGLMIASISLVALPNVVMAYANGNTAAIMLIIAVMVVFGFGFAMIGDSHNTLIAEITEGKKNRSGVVSAVWVFTILSSIICAIVISIVLQNVDTATGAPKACLTEACSAIRKANAIAWMPTFFAVGPIVSLIGLLPVLGLEKRLTRDELAHASVRPELNIKQAYNRIFTNPQARVFFFFIFVAIFALFLQDDVLESFGADVFKMTVSDTSRLQPIMGGSTLIAMLVMGIVASKAAISKRTIANWGAILAAIGFAMLAGCAFTHSRPLLTPALIVLGAGMGVFNIGGLSMMMDMTIPGEAGSLMGAWGMAQALANGTSQIVGGFLRDAGLMLTGSATSTYAFIFGSSVILCVVAINLMVRVDVQRFRKMTREQLGLAIEAA